MLLFDYLCNDVCGYVSGDTLPAIGFAHFIIFAAVCDNVRDQCK